MTDIAILIINWNNAPDTIAAIRSVAHLSDARIVVLDNASADDSVAQLRAFLSAEHDGYDVCTTADAQQIAGSNHPIWLVTSPENLGFAKGNNMLLQHLLQDPRIHYAWLLNNDAIALPDALQYLKQQMQADERCAFTGSVILDYAQPELVQCCGVQYYKYFAASKLQLKNRVFNELTTEDKAGITVDFLNGASFMVRMNLLRQIGLMDERFFIYSEEHDWQHRAQEQGYTIALAWQSIVHHKGSVSTANKKHLFYYYYNKSGIQFSRKHYNIFVNLVASALLGGITLLRTRLQLKSLAWGLKGILHGWTK